ncbi:MAG TPA: crossover junction endodeoxyribonuclease RuvC [Magnetospirillaceae bacterium]|nr:crossover junction endodeoxyribonuclease RuvC [Magnetospirillaceae bacterium]
MTGSHPPAEASGGAVRILGLDPGLASTGWGVVDAGPDHLYYLAHGCIITSASNLMEDRLLRIYERILEIAAFYRPSECAIEVLYFAKNVTSALAVSEARGVMRLACRQSGMSVSEYGPSAIKQALVGRGRADKAQVQEFARILLGLAVIPRPEHAADALAAAVCHAHSRAFPGRDH